MARQLTTMITLKPMATSLLLSITGICSSQAAADTIEICKTCAQSFLYHGKKQTPGQLMTIMRYNPDAYNQIKRARSSYATGQIFGFIGGFLIGWPLGQAIAGRDPNWAMAGIGAGTALLSIPFYSTYKKKAKIAVRLYNASVAGETENRR